MSQTAESEKPPGRTAERHPLGLYILFATEMWERFGFYTMLAMLTLYLQDAREGFGWTKTSATRLYAYYLMFVYFSPLIGGFIADRVLGFRRSILIGAVTFIAGYLLLTIHSVAALYGSLTLLVVANGFFKPNISTLVGNLYPAGSGLRDSAYNIFYMGINIGAFLAPLVAEALKQHFGFHVAFGAAAIGMGLGLAIFWTFQHHLEGADKKSEHAALPAELSDADVAACTEDVPPPHQGPSALEQVPEWKRITALLVIFTIVIVFWMGFHQNGSTFTYFANDNTDWSRSRVIPFVIKVVSMGTIKSDQVSGVISNSINPFWIIVLSLPLVRFWGWLNRRGREPSTPMKMVLGMTLIGVAYMILYVAALSGGDTGRVSPWWLIGAYLVISLGELMLSPMGLSLVSKVAPARMRGLMMGCWFGATAIGNLLTKIGEYWDVWKHSTFFLVLGLMLLGTAVLLLALVKPLKKAMPGV